MAQRALRPCKHCGCTALTRDKTGYCAAHKNEADENRRAAYRDRSRGTARERGYTTQWDKARKAYLSRNPLCVECLKDNEYIPATVVDHIIPHKGNKELFWDVGNWQSLCKRHHDQKTARGE